MTAGSLSQPDTKWTVLYARVSTTEQERDGVSLDDQIARARAYCHSLKAGYDPVTVKVCRDAGVSGSVPMDERPKGRLLMQYVRERRVQHIVAFRLDRLFRDAGNCLDVTKEWDRLGVTLHLLDLGGQAINTSSATGRFMLTIVAAAAEMERNVLRERTKSALDHKRSRGDWMGDPPLGYTLAEPGKPLQPVPAELATVQLILKLRRRDPSRWSFHQIADRLTAEGHKTKRGGRWAASTVKKVWDRRDVYQQLAP